MKFQYCKIYTEKSNPEDMLLLQDSTWNEDFYEVKRNCVFHPMNTKVDIVKDFVIARKCYDINEMDIAADLQFSWNIILYHKSEIMDILHCGMWFNRYDSCLQDLNNFSFDYCCKFKELICVRVKQESELYRGII